MTRTGISFSFSVPWVAVAVAGHAPVPPAHRRGCPTSRGPRVGGTAGARSSSGRSDVGRCVPYGYGPTREVGADPNQLPLLVARNALARRFLPPGAGCLALGAAERRGPPRAVRLGHVSRWAWALGDARPRNACSRKRPAVSLIPWMDASRDAFRVSRSVLPRAVIVRTIIIMN